MSFLFEIINSVINCSTILELVDLYAPARCVRKRLPFVSRHFKSKYGPLNSISRIITSTSSYVDDVDVFLLALLRSKTLSRHSY